MKCSIFDSLLIYFSLMPVFTAVRSYRNVSCCSTLIVEMYLNLSGMSELVI